MPIQISLKFDEGEREYNRALKAVLDGLDDFSGLWKEIIRYLEGDGDQDLQDPTMAIWKSKGTIINGKWTNSLKYEKIKDKIWQKRRKVSWPFPKWEQILSGHQLAALRNSSALGAVRVITKWAMAWGVQNDYSQVQQKKKKFMDFYPAMIRDIDRITARWINEMGRNWQGE